MSNNIPYKILGSSIACRILLSIAVICTCVSRNILCSIAWLLKVPLASSKLRDLYAHYVFENVWQPQVASDLSRTITNMLCINLRTSLLTQCASDGSLLGKSKQKQHSDCNTRLSRTITLTSFISTYALNFTSLLMVIHSCQLWFHLKIKTNMQHSDCNTGLSRTITHVSPRVIAAENGIIPHS